MHIMQRAAVMSLIFAHSRQLPDLECNVGTQGVTAIALNVSSSSAPWLAAAQRVSKRTVRITVHELIPGISLASQLHSMPTSQVYQADLTEPLLVKVRTSRTFSHDAMSLLPSTGKIRRRQRKKCRVLSRPPEH